MYQLSRLMLLAAVAIYCYCLVLSGMLGFTISPVIGWVFVFIGFIALARMRQKIGLALTAHGSAYWAGENELRRAGMIEARRGLILGRLLGSTKVGLAGGIKGLLNARIKAKDACRLFFSAVQRRQPAPLVRLPQAITAVCFAPPGAGKSTGLVIPFLLTCEESCVVIDFSGELALATANVRRRMGHEVVILDPYGVVTPKLHMKSATYNPIDGINKNSPLALDDCNGVAKELVVRTGDEKEPHWLDSAEAHISAVAATVVQYGTPGRRSLQEVSDVLASPNKLELCKKLMKQSLAWDGMLARHGSKLDFFVDKEKGSVLTTVNRSLRFLDTPAMAASTRASSFNPAKLKRGKMTVYIVLPPEQMKAGMGWLRLIVGSMIRAVVCEGPDERRKVHFVLDESASLGVMDSIEDLVDKMRKYGCRAQFYYQSAGQLMKCWPKDQGQTLMSSASKIYFGVSDIQTAQVVSAMLGKETIVVEGGGSGTSGGSNRGWSQSAQGGSTSGGSNNGWNSNESWQQAPRELLKPEEVISLPPLIAISFPGGGVPPVCTRLVRHFEEPRLAKLASGGGWLSRVRAACRTLIGSAIILAAGILLAAMLTEMVKARPAPQRQPAPVPMPYRSIWPK
jgi:type IV secretion system protein VirD4